MSEFEADVQRLAREMAAAERRGGRSFGLRQTTNRAVMQWAMNHPSFKTQLFRFVDVFPAMVGDADVLRHIEEYFEGADTPKVLHLGIDLADRVPLGGRMSASVARRNITTMAQQFIVGTGPTDAVEGLHRLWRQGSAFTVDLLGEKTVTEAEADRYASRVLELLGTLTSATASWAPDDILERDDLGPLPRVNISIKPTALASHYAPLTRADGIAEARARLLPILQQAAATGAFVYFDMEHYDVKDLTIELFHSLLDDPSLAGLDAGIVIQAYLRDAEADLVDLISWSAGRSRAIGIRLVKGAYWDAETITSTAEGWRPPVFDTKDATDASFERCTRLLHEHHGVVRAAFGSHNLRSLAYAVTSARALGIPDAGYELQMLYGMAEPIQAAIRRLGFRLRIYGPVGELVPGMAYLVRRLLENTSNESFVRHRFAEGRDLDELLAPPSPAPPVTHDEVGIRTATDPGQPGAYRHEPHRQWRRAAARSLFATAVSAMDEARTIVVPAVIAGERITTAAAIESTDPADPSRLVARSAACGVADADAAVAAALAAEDGWRRTPVAERAAVLFRAAAWMRERRDGIAALEVFEAGKPWAEADGDVCEAIDFCEYYGREMLRLDRGGVVESPPGEANELRYQGKGIGVVVAPWNFPLAIPTGMVSAAIAAGNPVILKPAEQTPATAYRLVEALEAGGLPPGVIGFVPGDGEVVGAHLVRHRDVAFIAFTGSMAVGLAINREAAATPGARHVKRVVAEMGGKNAIVIDADADLDHAVPAIVASAFGFAGQKCSAASRLVVVDAVHDEVVARLVGATSQLRMGHPRDMGTQLGPVIDEESRRRIEQVVASASAHGRVLLGPRAVPQRGHFVSPVIVGDVDPSSPLATEEVFGPVLAVFRATDFEHALAIANDTPFALTAGVMSRSPRHIRMAAGSLRAGNVYINRGTTGATVGRQPFGGYGMSGVGSKAGGPDYLLQFLDPRVVTENTLRQGFAPEVT